MRLAGSTLQVMSGARQKMSGTVLHCFLTSAILPHIEKDLAACETTSVEKKAARHISWGRDFLMESPNEIE